MKEELSIIASILKDWSASNPRYVVLVACLKFPVSMRMPIIQCQVLVEVVRRIEDERKVVETGKGTSVLRRDL